MLGMRKPNAKNRKYGADIRSSVLGRRIVDIEVRVKELERLLNDAKSAANYAGQSASAALYVANYCR
jgi:hypothetical protein